MKNKYFITWQYSYLEYPTNRFETVQFNGMSVTQTNRGIERKGTCKQVIEVDSELSIKDWEQFISDFEEDKAKELVEHDLERRDYVNINIIGITKL